MWDTPNNLSYSVVLLNGSQAVNPGGDTINLPVTLEENVHEQLLRLGEMLEALRDNSPQQTARMGAEVINGSVLLLTDESGFQRPPGEYQTFLKNGLTEVGVSYFRDEVTERIYNSYLDKLQALSAEQKDMRVARRLPNFQITYETLFHHNYEGISFTIGDLGEEVALYEFLGLRPFNFAGNPMTTSLNSLDLNVTTIIQGSFKLTGSGSFEVNNARGTFGVTQYGVNFELSFGGN